MFGFEVQPAKAERAFHRIVALIDPDGEVQKISDQVGDFAAVVLEDLALGGDIFLKGIPGALGAGIVFRGVRLVFNIEIPDGG